MLRAAAGTGFSLSDAASICLDDCPALLPAGQLSWVCKYPNSEGVQWVDPTVVPSLSAWTNANFDYFAGLNSTFVASSCALQGPCYPVLTPQLDSHHTCQYEALQNVPLNTAAVASFQSCVNCCTEAAPQSDPVCTATDSSGHPTVWSFQGNTTTPNGYILCLNSCQELHQSIESFVDSTVASISPDAYAQFVTTCAAATGLPPASVPAPGTQDGGLLAQAAAQEAASKKSMADRYVGDIALGWRAMVVCGLLLPFLLSLLWMGLLRFLAAPLIYGTLVLVDFGLLAITLYCFSKAGVISSNELGAVRGSVSLHNGQLSFNASNITAAVNASVSAVTMLNNASSTALNSTTTGLIVDVAKNAKLQMYYLGIAGIVFTVVAWILTAFFLPRIRVAIATLKVACDVITHMPSLVLQPVAASAITVLFMAWWIASGVFIYSSGEIVKRDCCASVQSSLQELYPDLPSQVIPPCGSIPCGYEVVINKTLRTALIYHGFMLLWGTQMIVCLGVLTVSQVTYAYYAFAGGAGEPVARFALPHAAYIATRFYAGPAAFASFLIALIQSLQIGMVFLTDKLKALTAANPAAKILLWLANLLLAALERLVALISKNGLILVAIEGHGFCSSATGAVSLLLSNAAQISTMSAISSVMFFIGKVGVAVTSAFFTFVYLEKVGVSSPLLPVIIVFCVSYGIALLFFGVVSAVVDTVLLAYCNDCAKHGGKPAWAPPLLLEAVGAASAVDKAKAEAVAKAKDAASKAEEGKALPVSKRAG